MWVSTVTRTVPYQHINNKKKSSYLQVELHVGINTRDKLQLFSLRVFSRLFGLIVPPCLLLPFWVSHSCLDLPSWDLAMKCVSVESLLISISVMIFTYCIFLLNYRNLNRARKLLHFFSKLFTNKIFTNF